MPSYYYTNYAAATTVATAAIVGAIIGAIIGLAIAIFTFFLITRLLKNTKIESWKGWIPFYNFMLVYKVAGVNPWFALISYVPFLFTSIPFVGWLFWLVGMAAQIYFGIYVWKNILKIYGKYKENDTASIFWIIGLIVIPPIMLAILVLNKNNKFNLGAREKYTNFLKDPGGIEDGKLDDTVAQQAEPAQQAEQAQPVEPVQPVNTTNDINNQQ